MVLTDKQKQELNIAILDYLISEGDKFSKTIEAFQQESGVELGNEAGKGMLEKKWTAIIRLQKKVLELESKLGSQSNNGNELRSNPNGEDSKLLPKGPPRATLSGHRGPVTTVATHPVYSLIASGSEDTTIKLWDYETGQYERTLKGHTAAITSVVFSPSGQLLASASADMSAKLWDTTTFQCIKTLRGHDHTLSSICFSSNSDFIYTSSRDHTIKCWEVSTGFSIRTYNGHGDAVKCLTVSNDGNFLASGGVDHNVIVWKAETGTVLQTLRGHEHVIEAVSLGCLHYSALVALSGNNSQNSLPQPPSNINDDSSKPSANNSIPIPIEKSENIYLVSGSRDRTIRLWDPLQGQCLGVFSGHDNWVRGVSLHNSGKYIISCSDDKSIRVFDIKEGRCIRTISDSHNHFVTCLSLSKNNTILISGSVDKNICVWVCN